MKERVLITGAAGFVGANLVRRLIKENYEVHILTRESTNMWRLKDIYNFLHDHKVDLLNRKKLFEVAQKINPKKICHLAIYGGYSFQKDEKKIIETNFNGTVNLLESLTNIDYDCFINTGSSSEYGPKTKPMIETDICEPDTIYGVAKAASTMYCKYKSETENKNIGTLRIFSAYGDFEEKARLITTLFTSLLNGKDVKLGNPGAARDFVYVQDIVEAYLKVLKNPIKFKGEIYNLCSGNQSKVSDIANIIKNILNSSNKLEYGMTKGRVYDRNIWVGNGGKFKEIFDWNPMNIESGLIEAAKWFEKNVNLYKED